MSSLVAIHLYGVLAEKYGALHHYEVSNPREAVNLLDANYPGFLADFHRHETYGLHSDGDWLDCDPADAPIAPVARELHIVPFVEGGGPLLFVPMLAWVGITGFAATLISGALYFGLLIGLSFLFKPKKAKAEEQKRDSFMFTGPENVIAQGVAVPLVYGEVYCGSVVVSTGLEVNNISNGYDLQSRQIARVVDLISEGPIGGFASPSGQYYSVWLDGAALANASGGFNFSIPPVMTLMAGQRNQPVIAGNIAQEQEVGVGVELTAESHTLTRTITNPDVDRVRITLSTPALYDVNDKGEYRPESLYWAIQITGIAGAFNPTWVGKSQGRYQASYIFTLPKGYAPWTIYVTRNSGAPPDATHANQSFWDSYTEIIDDKVNYALSAICAMSFDSEAFNSVPKRTYLIKGLYILVPNNYDEINGTYSGTWSGVFKTAWTNNPVWIWLDLLCHPRRGLGRFIGYTQVDRALLYKIAQYCDARVSNGKGGTERRHVCNVQIMNQSEAFDLLAQIAAIFRGFYYWSGGMLLAGADMPANPVYQFTNANVKDGAFNYSGADLRAQHNQALVGWQDPTLHGDVRIAIVEDAESISRLGIQPIEFQVLGCTSEAQAVRAGKWALYVEQYESQAVSFRAGLEAAYCKPGDIIQVMDVNVSGERRGGRLLAGSTTTHIILDGPLDGIVSGNWFLYCVMPDGTVKGSQVASISPGGFIDLDPDEPYPSAPLAGMTWVLVDIGRLEASQWRVTSLRFNADDESYDVNAVRHLPGKYDFVEKNIALTEPDISDIVVIPPPVKNLKITEYFIQLSAISIGVEGTLTWESQATKFEVQYRPDGDNWRVFFTDLLAVNLPLTEGWWEFKVSAITGVGKKSLPVTLRKEIIGRYAPPKAPQNFRVNVVDNTAMFHWGPATELDVIIGGHFELRHTSAVSGATWAGSQIIIPSIPGSATSAEAGYRVGTWFLRTFDIVGLASADAPSIVALEPDSSFTEFARICENPDWIGIHNYTQIREDTNWLIIGQTGGRWDEQLTNMDTWTEVDVLPGSGPPEAEPRHGWYDFGELIDAGGVFAVRFSSDVLAFPYIEGGELIDARLDLTDDWPDWDSGAADLNSQVVVMIRHTDEDPSDPDALWTDWQNLSPAQYVARGFEFRADLYAPIGQNIGVETLCILADLRNKIDANGDIPYPAARVHVTFAIKFYMVPAVVITVQDAASTDNIVVLNKTREGFDLDIKNNSGVYQTRTFDWQAQGY